MFSVIFPGQGSQVIGMGKEFFEKYSLVKNLFKQADEALGIPLSKIILEGPKEELDQTVNTQPAIFLVSYSIFQVMNKEFNIDFNKSKYFAGVSIVNGVLLLKVLAKDIIEIRSFLDDLIVIFDHNFNLPKIWSC